MSGLEITYTRIEYFDPARNAREYETESEPEGSVLHANNIPLPSDKPPESKKPKGAVKSIETLSVNKVFSKTGKVENRAVSESEKTNHESFKDNNIQKEQETPVPDPKRWRYIFYLALLAVGVFLYFKRKEILKNVKRFFSK